MMELQFEINTNEVYNTLKPEHIDKINFCDMIFILNSEFEGYSGVSKIKVRFDNDDIKTRIVRENLYRLASELNACENKIRLEELKKSEELIKSQIRHCTNELKTTEDIIDWM